MTRPNNISLYNKDRQRKYLTAVERERFYPIAISREPIVKYFLLMLYYSGARISEVLNLEVTHIDFEEQIVIIESLKKRKKGVFRVIQLPTDFLTDLKNWIEQNNIQGKIWVFTRRTASRYVKSVMIEAEIRGIQACSKGLRHSFAVSAIEQNIPISKISEWMGHSSMETTAIYLKVCGQEDRRFAERMW